MTPQPVETLSKYAVMASVMLPIWFTFKRRALAAWQWCQQCHPRQVPTDPRVVEVPCAPGHSGSSLDLSPACMTQKSIGNMEM